MIMNSCNIMYLIQTGGLLTLLYFIDNRARLKLNYSNLTLDRYFHKKKNRI